MVAPQSVSELHRPPGDERPVADGSGPTRRRYSAPLVVGVTGHRDLLPAEMPGIRARVREFLMHLNSEYPDRDLVLLTPLAEGADRLVAEEALVLGLPVTAVLPMPRALYAEDFRTTGSRSQFDRLCAAATDLFELPLTAGNTPGFIEEHGPNRARQYAQLGVFLSAHCHILLALWDGRDSTEIGGTAQVVRFHQDDVMPGFAPRSAASRLTLLQGSSRPHAGARPRAAGLRLVHARRRRAAHARAAREVSSDLRPDGRVQCRRAAPRRGDRPRRVSVAAA